VAESPVGHFDDLRPLAQIFGTYILACAEQDFYIIDQHAAHERIRYEHLLHDLRLGENHSQLLLVPEPLELSAGEEEILLENFALLRDLGFILEEFGPRTYLLRGVPLFHSLTDPHLLLCRFLDEVREYGAAPLKEALLERWVFLVACRYAIKAEESLSLAAMSELLAALGKTENPYTCPHGRPVLLKMSRAELEKWFARS
jgi:DNA mismatch repair protein MutL